jgi:3-dehydroquinate synthetase
LGYIDAEALNLHYRLIEDVLGLRPSLPDHLNAANIFDAMYVDNKKIGQDVRFVLLEGIGACKKENGGYLVHVDEAIVRGVIEAYFQKQAHPNPIRSELSGT